jgi:hypothetical protein
MQICKKQHKEEKPKCYFQYIQEEKTQDMSVHDRIDYNRRVVEEFRANGGKVQGWAPLILLTTKGARSGQTWS